MFCVIDGGKHALFLSHKETHRSTLVLAMRRRIAFGASAGYCQMLRQTRNVGLTKLAEVELLVVSERHRFVNSID